MNLLISYDSIFKSHPSRVNLGGQRKLFYLQDRQRAPKQQISRCLENGTRIDLSLSEISDEEVDYGSYASNVDLDIASDSSWSAL